VHGSWRFRHLTVDECRFRDNSRLFHFKVEIVALSRPFTHSAENGDAAVMHGDVMDHLHHDDCLADTGAAEHPHLTASGKGNEEVDYLDPRFENVHRGILLRKAGGLSMDRHLDLGVDRTESVHRSSDDVENPSEAGLTDGNHDRATHTFHSHPPYKAVCYVHGDTSDGIAAKVLGNLDNQIVFLVVDRRVCKRQSIEDVREIPVFEYDVYNRPNDLDDFSFVHIYSP